MSLADGFIPRPEQPGTKRGGWLVRLALKFAEMVKRKGAK